MSTLPQRHASGTSQYLSPLIAEMAIEHRPDTCCTSCPASVWYRDDEVRCFCSILKDTTYRLGAKKKSQCDGRTLALANLDKSNG